MMLMFSDGFRQWAGFRFEEYKSILQKLSRTLDLQQEFVEIIVSEKIADAVAEGQIGKIKQVGFNVNEKFHSLWEFAFVAAHEMRHIWQYTNKVFLPWIFHIDVECGYTGKFGVWKNCLIYIPANHKQTDHFSHPFEVDANEFAHLFVENIEQDRENSVGTFWSDLINRIMDYYAIYGFKDTLSIRKASMAYYNLETVELAYNELKHRGCKIEDY